MDVALDSLPELAGITQQIVAYVLGYCVQWAAYEEQDGFILQFIDGLQYRY